VFARQDLSSDPPFSNVDLISCRNVLVYRGNSLQQRIMPIFHYSLNQTGFLLLGTSESTGKYTDLFTVVEKNHRIYAKNPTAIQSKFSLENQIDGVVLVLLDIDALKRSAATVEAARNYAEAIVETVQVPLLLLEADFRVNTTNRSFCETFQVSQ
jgi:PAS domain-containing protein